MIDFLDIAKEHGLTAAILTLLIPGAWWVSRLDKQVKTNTEAIATVHEGCRVNPESLPRIEGQIHLLEVQDANISGDISTMNQRLDDLADGQKEMKADIKIILTHFATKGMDA